MVATRTSTTQRSYISQTSYTRTLTGTFPTTHTDTTHYTNQQRKGGNLVTNPTIQPNIHYQSDYSHTRVSAYIRFYFYHILIKYKSCSSLSHFIHLQWISYHPVLLFLSCISKLKPFIPDEHHSTPCSFSLESQHSLYQTYHITTIKHHRKKIHLPALHP